MMIHYRQIYGIWRIYAWSYFPWNGLDYSTDSYWIVPGTIGHADGTT